MSAGAALQRRSGWSIFRRVMGEMRGYRPHLCGIALLGVCMAPLGLLNLAAIQVVVDSYLGEKPLQYYTAWLMPTALTRWSERSGYLVFAGGLILLGVLLNQGFGFAKSLLRVYTKEHMVLGLRARLFGHVERLSLSYHDDKGPSEATFRIMMDTMVIPGVPLDALIPSLQALVLVVVYAALILVVSPQLALVAVLVAPLQLLVSWPFGRSLRRQWHEIKELDTSVLGRVQEVFGAVRVIKAFGREEGETQHLMTLAERGLWKRVRVARTQAWFSAWNALAAAVGLIAFLWVGAHQVKSGATLTLTGLGIAAWLMVSLKGPLTQLVGLISSLQTVLASAERVLQLLDQAPAVVEKPDARPLGRARGSVEFREVSFGYQPEESVLDRLSFAVSPGQRIGIAGHTGAGKTTLVNLLTRLHDPQSGAVLLDGDDLRDLRLNDLNRQFAIVLQEPVLFKQSIADNIRYARPDASFDEVVRAARMADADRFITALPDGYDTIVGERGQKLSGGQRQRISLARAVLKDPPIL
ncbi:MAG: ABC transporter ATP-binding protein, partial [Planctomycetes bacterium]|nr:ABC transporter ATP-binding protein [Planctomycetota bacterium]